MNLTQNHYETVYVLKAALNDKDVTVLNDKVDSVVKKFGGEIKGRDDWGVKELSYDVEGERSGRYVVVNYHGNSGVVEEIERHFKIFDDVIRFLTVRVEPTYDYGALKRQIVAAEEEGKFREERRNRDEKRDRGGPGGGGYGGRDHGREHNRDFNREGRDSRERKDR